MHFTWNSAGKYLENNQFVAFDNVLDIELILNTPRYFIRSREICYYNSFKLNKSTVGIFNVYES